MDTASGSSSVLRQLGLYALLTIIGIVLLMWAMSWIASVTGSAERTQTAIDAEARSASFLLGDEPPQLDSSKATDALSGMVLGHVMEGLLAYNENNQLTAGVAERWDIRERGATFWLRRDARWSNGEPITAHDFVYSWRTAVDPVNSSQYAFLLYAVKNGEAITQGKLPVEELGVRAIDDYTLEVEFENSTAYFGKLVAFSTYYPINEKFHKAVAGRFGADADTLLYSGPYMIDSWVHGASLKMVRNPHYWNPDRGGLDIIDFPYITPDPNARLNLFKDGKIAIAGLSAEHLNEAINRRWQMNAFAEGVVFYIEFNHRPGRVTGNLHLRRAMQLVNDPAELVYKVTKLPGYLPGKSLFPVWVQGVNGFFRQEYPAPEAPVNIEQARWHLEQAKKELGVDEIPPLMLLTGDNPLSTLQSEYYQNRFRRTLGLEVRIDKQIFKQRLEKMTAGEFDLVMAGWGPDFDDPLTFGDLFASWNEQNRGKYASAALDAQVRIAQRSVDTQERMDAFGEIQQILFDDAVILPGYERGIVYVVDDRLEGVVRRAVGPDPDYTFARIKEGS